MPSVSVITLIGIERIAIPKYETLFVILYTGFAISTIYLGFHKLPLHILTEEEKSSWEKAYEYVEKYSEFGDIFYSRSLAYDGFEKGNGEWICDHDGEVSQYTVDELIAAGVPEKCLDMSEALVVQNLKYREYIRNKAESHGYSLITFETMPKQRQFDEEFCEDIGYRCIDRLKLQMGNMPYNVSFYVPGF